jgi:hydrogenase assembly chaperone HypC/HupF
MCISVPARVRKIDGASAQVEVNGLRRDVLINLIDVQVDSWVLLYAGAALKVISEQEAREILSLLEGLGA